MLSVIIQSDGDAAALAGSLAALVDAAVEGLVAEVIVTVSGSSDEVNRIADDAGCTIVEASDVSAAIERARKDWVLFLEPGARPVGDWAAPVADHLSRLQSPARFSRSSDERLSFLERLFYRPHALENGLLMTRRQASNLAKSGKTAERLANGVAAKKLSAQLVPASQK